MSSAVNVLITLSFPEELLSRLRAVSPRLQITAVKAAQASEIPAETWQRTEVLYTSQALPAPEAAPNLRWVQFHAAGVDHATTHPILAKPGLTATTLSGAAVQQMGEYVLTMMLALGHRLPDLTDRQRKAEWPKDRRKLFTPQELNQSTVGIIGYGSIGRELARLLRCFGAVVLAAKRNAMDTDDPGYVPEGLGDVHGDLLRRLYPIQAVRAMLKESDFVVIALPLTPETKGLVGVEELAAMKPSAFLIDVSRGGVVNHPALIQALREKKIAGAALDVYPEEPLPADSPLWKLPNVILTPHIAGISQKYDERAADLFIENLQRYLAGQPLYNRIDPKRGY